jgi:hypothetical protein
LAKLGPLIYSGGLGPYKGANFFDIDKFHKITSFSQSSILVV